MAPDERTIDERTLEEWRASLAGLGRLLVDFEANPAVELARAGGLTGSSAAAWGEADAAVTGAWDTYRAVDEPLNRAAADPRQTAARLATATVPSPDGPADPATALARATAAVEAALALAGKLSDAWGEQVDRARAAQAAAAEAGDEATARAADALVRLLATDPLAATAADVAVVEAAAAEASRRHAAAETAVARLDIDLAQARASLAGLRDDLAAAAGELDHAASRIAGLGRPDPVPDLDELAGWLDRIAATAEHDRARAAGHLANWVAAADRRRAELDAARDAARAAMARRENGRGLWKALRAKAAARRVDERADVARALAEARAELWHAPCDLAVAEAGLAKLSALLNTPPGGGR